MIAITVIACLMCVTSFIRTDTIIKDNPAQFNAMATDANGKQIPVNGEVDTIQVFDIHQLGQDLNDTGLKIDIDVSPLNATTPKVPISTTTTTAPPPVKLSDLRFPQNVTTFSKVPSLVPQVHPNTSSVTFPSSFINYTSENSAVSETTNSTPSYPPSSTIDQNENSHQYPKFPWWPDSNGSNNVSSFDASKSPQYSNMFGARPFFGPWGGQQSRSSGPHADAAPYPINFNHRLNDTNPKSIAEEKNETSNGILGFFNELLPKTSKNHDTSKSVDDLDLKNEPSMQNRANVDSSVKDDELIDPNIYVSNYWDPSRWNSFTNISFDKDESVLDKEQKSPNMDKNNNGWFKKPPVEFASFNAFRMDNSTPIWMVNVSSLDATRLFQQPFSFNTSSIFDTLNFTKSPVMNFPTSPLLINPPSPFAMNFPIPWMTNVSMPHKKVTLSMTTEQSIDMINNSIAAKANASSLSATESSGFLTVLQTVKDILKNLTNNVPSNGLAFDTANDTSGQILRNLTAQDGLTAKDLETHDDDFMMNDSGDVNGMMSDNVSDLGVDAPNMLKGNIIDPKSGQSSISLPSTVSLLLLIGGILTGTTSMFM